MRDSPSTTPRAFPARTKSVGMLTVALLAGLAFAYCAGALAQAPDAQPSAAAKAHAADVERSNKTYAIYSMLLPGPPFDSMPTAQVQHLAIAGTTVNLNDMNPRIAPDSELSPPPGNERAFHEAVADFRARRLDRVQLTRKLQIDRDYQLVNKADENELRQVLAGADPGSQLHDKWAGYAGITFFSEVYFNTAQTAALVYMGSFCANLCANSQWVYLEKQNGQWVRRSGLNV